MKKFVKISGMTYFGKGESVVDDLHVPADVVLSFNDTTAFTRMVKDGCLYVSHLKNNERSNNSIAQMADGRFIRIIKFLVDKKRSTEFTLCNVIETSGHNFCNNYVTLQKIRRIENEVSVVPTANMNRICIHIEVESEFFITPCI